jgi:polyisoprenoid-binding protein YceI
VLHRRSVQVAAAALFTVLAAPASAAEWTFDPPHTQATFTVTHLAISKVRGTIPLVAGTLTPGSNELPSAVSATFDVSKLDTHDAQRDASLRSADWFDVAKYPTMTFVSTKITGTPQEFHVLGNLTMHGVTKPVTLDAKLEGTLVDNKGIRHLAYAASTTFDRRAWGLTWGNVSGGQLIAGYDVTVDLEVDATDKPER